LSSDSEQQKDLEECIIERDEDVLQDNITAELFISNDTVN